MSTVLFPPRSLREQNLQILISGSEHDVFWAAVYTSGVMQIIRNLTAQTVLPLSVPAINSSSLSSNSTFRLIFRQTLYGKLRVSIAYGEKSTRQTGFSGLCTCPVSPTLLPRSRYRLRDIAYKKNPGRVPLVYIPLPGADHMPSLRCFCSPQDSSPEDAWTATVPLSESCHL